jgi:hypothetical protein
LERFGLAASTPVYPRNRVSEPCHSVHARPVGKVLLIEPVETPLPDITDHVVEPESVRGEAPTGSMRTESVVPLFDSDPTSAAPTRGLVSEVRMGRKSFARKRPGRLALSEPLLLVKAHAAGVRDRCPELRALRRTASVDRADRRRARGALYPGPPRPAERGSTSRGSAPAAADGVRVLTARSRHLPCRAVGGM